MEVAKHRALFYRFKAAGNCVVQIFSAIVDEDIAYSEAKFRQEKYLEALGTLPNLKIITGKYQKKLVRCQAECAQEYSVPREKKTDVNIAVHMISDCLDSALDSLVLVSDDSDLEPAIAWIHKKYPNLPITVYIPKLPENFDVRRYDFYKGIGVICDILPIKRLRTFQFPTAVKIATAKFVQRPEEWAARF